MIKQIFVSVLVLTTLIAAADAPAEGSIIMYRGAGVLGAAVACPIRHEGQEIVELGRGKFAKWDVKPGRYILTNKTSSIEVNVEAGETRYIRCSIEAGFLSGRADLQVIDQASFEAVKNDLEMKVIR